MNEWRLPEFSSLEPAFVPPEEHLIGKLSKKRVNPDVTDGGTKEQKGEEDIFSASRV